MPMCNVMDNIVHVARWIGSAGSIQNGPQKTCSSILVMPTCTILSMVTCRRYFSTIPSARKEQQGAKMTQVECIHSMHIKNALLLVHNEERVREMCSFDRGPLPPLSTEVDTDVIHMIKWTRPFPSAFVYCKQSKTGWWEGLE